MRPSQDSADQSLIRETDRFITHYNIIQGGVGGSQRQTLLRAVFLRTEENSEHISFSCPDQLDGVLIAVRIQVGKLKPRKFLNLS